MRSNAWLVTVLTMLGAPSVALARDHLELVCSGVVTSPKDGGERIPLFFHFFDSRASDGASRDQRLSTIYQGKMFQAHYLNKDEKSDVAIVLKRAEQVRFKGAYAVDNKGGNGPFTLHVVGKINEAPSAKRPAYREVDEMIPCIDLSI